jgi:hypothetical protein
VHRRRLVRFAAFVWTVAVPSLAVAQADYCAIALGSRPTDGAMLTQVTFNQPSPQAALNAVWSLLTNQGYQIVQNSSAVAYNGGAAVAVWRNHSGTVLAIASGDSSAFGALGAITSVLSTASITRSPSSYPWVRYIRCNVSSWVSLENLQQLTWSSSLTSRYAGHQATRISQTSHDGSFTMEPVPPQPVPTPSPYPTPPYPGSSLTADPLSGCWQQYLTDGRVWAGPGNIFHIEPRGYDEGRFSQNFDFWVGRYVTVGTELSGRSVKVRDKALQISGAPLVNGVRPGFSTDDYYGKCCANNHFTFDQNGINAIGTSADGSGPLKYVYRRVQCPR